MMMASNTLTSSSSSSAAALTASQLSSSSSSSPTTLSLSSSAQSIAAVSASSKLIESDSVIHLNTISQTGKSIQPQEQMQHKAAVKLSQSKTASTIDISESTNDSIKDPAEELLSKSSSSESQHSVSAIASSSTTTTVSDTNNASKTTVPITTTSSATTTAPITTAPTAPSPSPSTSLTSSDSRWIFPADKIINSPSRSDGMSMEDELTERQQAALFITDLGALLKVNQLCMNTAIIYMHRFFMIHSFKKFQRYMVATACLFFACKVEEQPRRLREFIEAIHKLFHSKSAASNEPFTHNSEEYRKYGEEIVAFESCLLQTLGFNVLVNHAHTVIIKTCQMIKAPRDLAEAAYLTATNSLILTNFCVKFSCEKVACFCIYLACKWTQLIIPTSSEGMQWYQYVKHDIVEQELEDISKEYLSIFDKCSPKIQRKLGMTKSSDDQMQQQQKQAQQVKKEPKPSHHPQQQQQQQQQPHPHHPSSQSIQKHPHKVHNQHPHHNGHLSSHHSTNPLKSHPQQAHPHSHHHQQQHYPQGHPMHKQAHHGQATHAQQHFKQHNKPPNLSTNHHHSSQSKTNGHPPNSIQQTGVNQNDSSLDMTKGSTNGQSLKAKVQQSQQQQQQQQQQAQIKTSPLNTSITAGSTSIKRINEDLNNVSSAPKIRKYVIDQNSTT